MRTTEVSPHGMNKYNRCHFRRILLINQERTNIFLLLLLPWWIVRIIGETLEGKETNRTSYGTLFPGRSQTWRVQVGCFRPQANEVDADLVENDSKMSSNPLPQRRFSQRWAGSCTDGDRRQDILPSWGLQSLPFLVWLKWLIDWLIV